MSDGRVEYEVRADTSHLESDLNKAEKLVKDSVNATEKNVDKIGDSAEKSHKKAADATKKAAEETEKYRKETDESSEAQEEHSKKTDENTESQKKYTKAMEDAAGKTAAVGTALKATGAVFAAIGSAAIAVGTAAISGADSLDKATNQLTASLGLASDEAERYEETIKSIYANNYGESFENIANSVALVKQQMSDISDAELQKAVESGYLLSDVYGIDFQESLRGANSLVNQFGISATDAYNLIAQGAEKGLNQNADLADQIAEYATYYKNLGFTAEQAFNMMAAGAENGVYQIDKINDAVKEFSIRAIDGSDSTAAGFEALGLDADKLAHSFAEGGEQSAAAFQMVVDKLSQVSDKVEQDAIGVALFGTQWEDLGAEAVLALADVGNAIDSTRDKLGEMEEVKYSSLSDMFEAMKRSVELLLIPLGEQLIPVVSKVLEAFMPLAEEVIPQLTEAVLPLIECVLELISPLAELVSDILPLAIDLIQPIIETLVELAEEVFPILSEILEKLLPPIITIVESLLPPLLSIITALLPVIDTVLAILDPILALVLSLLEPITALLNSGIMPLINVLLELINLVLIPLMPLIQTICDLLSVALTASIGIVSDKFETFTKFISDRVKAIKEVFDGIVTFISGVFEGNWEKAWEGISKIFSGIWHDIAATAEFVINGLIDIINGFTSSINTLFGWMGANIGKLEHVDWTADDAEEQAKNAINDVDAYNNAPTPSGKTMADYYEAQGKAKLAEQEAQKEKEQQSKPVYSGNTVNGIDYSYIPKLETDSTKTKAQKTAAATKSSASSSKKGNVISITSYVPTVWDDEEEVNEKLKKSLGFEIMGNSKTGKIIDSIESAASVESGVSAVSAEKSENVTLSDVISAIKSLEKADETRKISLDVDLYARDLLIGTIAVADINDMTRMEGKSPLIQ